MNDPISDPEKEFRDKLLAMVKKEVKHIMEEAVTRKVVHEESSNVTSLCCAVDACLSHGLKRRALGLFKTNSTTALLQKVAKNYEPASELNRRVLDLENAENNKRSSSGSDSSSSFIFRYQNSLHSNNVRSTPKFLWIRIALFTKKLVGIIDHLVEHSAKYYEKEALVSDPVSGQILASLLVGPCALDYTKAKTNDHFWTDPPADELVQRHRISSPLNTSTSGTPPMSRRPLGSLKRISSDKSVRTSNGSEDICTPPRGSSLACSPRDYVDSLHQNFKNTLLYGKNNVSVQPSVDVDPMPGYLSLHSTHNSLVIKWTPNQLMNGSGHIREEDSSLDLTAQKESVMAKSPLRSASPKLKDDPVYWDYAMSVKVEDIVYLHCHQQKSGGTIVLIGQDGVHKPPITFPKGGHLLAFLSCLENGLSPFGQLDPPLWSQKGKGKVFPQLRRRRQSTRNQNSSNQVQSMVTFDEEDEEATDYVFRILANFEKPDTISQEMFDPTVKSNAGSWMKFWKKKNGSTSMSTSTCSTVSEKSIDEVLPTDGLVQIMCDSMRRQILARAFKGWLSHTRYMRTIRTHLSELVNPDALNVLDYPETDLLTPELWNSFHDSNGAIDPKHERKIYLHLYFAGCDHSIRQQVWPYLLNHYTFGMTTEERKQKDEDLHKHYELTMTEWLAVEAIVVQRDKELMAANLAKYSSESTSGSDVPVTAKSGCVGDQGPSMSNEVFTDDDGSDLEDISDKTELASEHDSKKASRVSVVSGKSNHETGNEKKKAKEGKKKKKPTESEGGRKVSEDSIGLANETQTGGIYTNELLDLFSLNIHRIDKDVQRCDRNYVYFMDKDNLEKLRNVMCTYVWEHLDQGYVQGMCDLVAPLLVIFDDEGLSYSCFIEIMNRMVANFPNGGAMDLHFANMRSLTQILDPELFDLMLTNGDYTHFYFCYRWFLLDFKRELLYDDVFRVWEAIWSSKHVATNSFILFLALALIEYYREIILENNMDFTDIIKFFNEMAERHDAAAVLRIARNLVVQIQLLLDSNH